MRMFQTALTLFTAISWSAIATAQPIHEANPELTQNETQAPRALIPTGSAGVHWQQQTDGTHSFLGVLPLGQAAAFTTAAARVAFFADRARNVLRQSQGHEEIELVQRSSESQADGDVAVLYEQMWEGVPVEGAYATALLHGNTLRYARQNLVKIGGLSVVPRLSQAQAVAAADDAMAQAPVDSHVSDAANVDLVIHYATASDGADEAHLAWKVAVHTMGPAGAWAVYVDAHTGAALHRVKVSQDGVAGHVSMAIEPDCTGDATILKPVPNVRWIEQGYTDATGAFSSRTTFPQARVALESPYIRMVNQQGSLSGPYAVALAPLPADNDVELDTIPLEQADPFYHVQTARAWLQTRLGKTINSQMRWTTQQLRVNVNVPEVCNAYWDPQASSLNLFMAGVDRTSGMRCLNTGRSASIVYHEYAHSIHSHSGGQVYSQTGEGIADYAAATISGDPQIHGLYACNDNFRSCVNTLSYCANGSCNAGPRTESHYAGQVICGALWEMRGLLAERYGDQVGIATSDRIYLKFLSVVGSLGSSYQAAIAADDDNDNDPNNGTVHSCEINRAFLHSEPGTKAHFPDAVAQAVPCVPL